MIRDRVAKAVQSVQIVDVHTHLFPPAFTKLFLSGPDELLTYHYLVAEALRFATQSPAEYFALDSASQADLVWRTLFEERSPVSEATVSVIETFRAYGAESLKEAREAFSDLSPDEKVNRAFQAAGVESVTMTNDPLVTEEQEVYESGFAGDARFRTALRIDPLIFGEDFSAAQLSAHIEKWTTRLNAKYVAVSLPPDFDPSDNSPGAVKVREGVMPILNERQLPFALMIGVRRKVNPALGLAGDGVGTANLDAYAPLMRNWPEVKFLVTTLARENTHELAVLARKFPNLTPFGCWWFVNTPSLIQETTLMRLELLGTSFIPQHSDARVLEQLIPKWRHSRRAISLALSQRYEAIEEGGVTVSDEQIERDASDLLRNNALAVVR